MTFLARYSSNDAVEALATQNIIFNQVTSTNRKRGFYFFLLVFAFLLFASSGKNFAEKNEVKLFVRETAAGW